MRLILTGSLLLALSLSLGGPVSIEAQEIGADRFLEGVVAHSVGDEAEKEQFGLLYQALNSGSATDVERVLPFLLRFTRGGNEDRVRGYAVGFLLDIAIRPDGAELLSSKSEEISSLIVDADPGIQKVAVAITDYVIARPATNKPPYVSALKSAIQKTETPQGVALGMVGPLLYTRFTDPSAVKPVLEFIHRNDLTANTRRELLHALGTVDGLPEDINRYLSNDLDDPDPTVRVSALVAFADSTTGFHTLAKDRVGRMANDPQENPKIRELAKQATAGKTHLDPNVLVPNVAMPPDKPTKR